MTKNFLWIRFVAFSYTFLFAFIVVNLWNLYFDKNITESKNRIVKQENQTISSERLKEKGSGFSGSYFGKDDSRSANLYLNKANNAKSQSLQITYKPKPKYTEQARNNNIQGDVRVRVTFLANGEIGLVSEVAGLPSGLTENAIESAKKIKFKPQMVNGKPITVTKVIAYTFTIY